VSVLTHYRRKFGENNYLLAIFSGKRGLDLKEDDMTALVVSPAGAINSPSSPLGTDPASQQLGVGLQKPAAEGKPADALDFSKRAREAAEMVRRARESEVTVQAESPTPPPRDSELERRLPYRWKRRRPKAKQAVATPQQDAPPQQVDIMA